MCEMGRMRGGETWTTDLPRPHFLPTERETDKEMEKEIEPERKR